jgi:SAM-dependent methyltransferase
VVAPRVGRLHCVDASARALAVAREALKDLDNVVFHEASVQDMPFSDGAMDFGYSLGVLHHVPEPQQALNACVAKLKPGAPFLVYLYYRFDNRPAWYRTLWRASDLGRRIVSKMPFRAKHLVTDSIALAVYLPLSRAARMAERLGRDVTNWPLSAYRHCSLYTLRTDALDRFGTRLEQRFLADEIRAMLARAGLTRIRLSDRAPFWCAVGYRA